MDKNVLDPKPEAIDSDCSPKKDSRGGYVLFPMMKSGAAIVAAVAFATVVAVAIAMPVSSSEPSDPMSAEGKAIAFSKEPRQADGTASADAPDGESKTVADSGGEAEDGKPAPPTEGAPGEAKAATATDVESGYAETPPSIEPELGGGSMEESGGATDSGHQHSWTAETETVDHPAKYEDVYHEAEYKKKKWTQCSCGDDITGDVSGHVKAHALAGESATYHTEESSVCVKGAWTEYGVLVKEAWSEEVSTGCEVCSCGARR